MRVVDPRERCNHLRRMTKTLYVVALAVAIGIIAVLLVSPSSLRLIPDEKPSEVSAVSLR